MRIVGTSDTHTDAAAPKVNVSGSVVLVDGKVVELVVGEEVVVVGVVVDVLVVVVVSGDEVVVVDVDVVTSVVVVVVPVQPSGNARGPAVSTSVPNV